MMESLGIILLFAEKSLFILIIFVFLLRPQEGGGEVGGRHQQPLRQYVRRGIMGTEILIPLDRELIVWEE